MKTFDLWYSRVDAEALVAQVQSAASAKRRKVMEKNVAKTRAKDSLRAFNKLTTIVDGEPRIVGDPPLIVPIEDLAGGRDIEAFARRVIRGYRRTLQGDRKHLLERFRYVHAARKVVGVGSVGTRAWIILMARPRQRRSVVPAAQGGSSPRCLSRSWARASTPITASGWSRASD